MLGALHENAGRDWLAKICAKVVCPSVLRRAFRNN
jgi:hypothetical protein